MLSVSIRFLAPHPAQFAPNHGFAKAATIGAGGGFPKHHRSRKPVSTAAVNTPPPRLKNFSIIIEARGSVRARCGPESLAISMSWAVTGTERDTIVHRNNNRQVKIIISRISQVPQHAQDVDRRDISDYAHACVIV
jgi:hypothetical protein